MLPDSLFALFAKSGLVFYEANTRFKKQDVGETPAYANGGAVGS